jgi:amino acid adenylation domain-containing protein
MTAPPTIFAAPMSSAQQRLWLLHRLSPHSAAYNISSAVTLDGPLDAAALQRSVDAIVARHETLRTFFREVDGEPRQLISDREPLEIRLHDLRHLPETAREEAARGLAAREAAQAFDLARLPLARVSLIRTAADRHVLVSVMHHIISDGWSMGVFARELALHYGGFSGGRDVVTADLPIQYADFAEWQREELERSLPGLARFWRDQLDGAPPLLELASDRPRRAVPTGEGGSIAFRVPARVAAALQRIHKDARASMFMTLLAAFSLLLSRQSGQTDVCVGTPVAGRSHEDVDRLIGFFVNMLPLRIDLSGGPTFSELLRRVRARTLDALAHQDMPFDRLVAEVQPQRHLSATPIFQAMFVLQNMPAEDLELPGLALTPFEIPRQTTQFDLSLSMREDGAGLDGLLEYSRDLFDRESAGRLVDQFEVLLSAIAESPDTPVADLPLLSGAAAHRIVSEWNATRRPYALETSLPRLLEAQAARTPDAVAVTFEGASLSYRALDREATRLAQALGAAGVSSGDVVGVHAERSLELVVALCAILKAGAAYCPLDPSYPADRLAYMVATAGARLVLTGTHLAAAADRFGVAHLAIDDPARRARESGRADLPAVHPDDLAYVIYTSGSTGRPKGVMVSHRAIVNRLLWMQDEYGLAPGDTVLQKTTFSFDVSVWEFFWPLVTGARLVVARPEGHRDAAYLARTVCDEGVTAMHFVPSMLTAFLDEPGVAACRSLRHVICSGEALPGALCDRFFARSAAALHNLYGPTEAAVDVTYWPCDRRAPRASIPIGRPIANIRMHVLDAEGRPSPVGVPGHLMIGGVGLARGYCGRPGLTADRFVPDPLAVAPGARLYRTGDRARYLADGALDFLGRLDHQVKLRGQRIEPGEIESALVTHPGVRASAVVLAGDTPDEQQLVAYVEGDAAVADAELRAHLLRSLPQYMVPAAFVRLDAIPLSPAGKLDRRALPAPGTPSPRAAATPPRTPSERIVAGVWRDVLALRENGEIDVHANFFELGGHSLRANQVVSRLQAQHRVALPLQAMFDAPTIAGLAARIDEGAAAVLPPPPLLARRPRPARIPLSYSQERLWFLYQAGGPSAAYNLSSALRLTGELDRRALAGALNHVVGRHEILRTTFAEADGVPCQVIHPAMRLEMPLVDLSHLAAGARDAEVRRLADEDALAVFDLERGPLVRAALLRLAADEHVLLSTVHHIVFDGWSGGVLVRELTQAYEAIAGGSTPPAGGVPQYADYAMWQREGLDEAVIARELEYWRGRLANLPEALALPSDFPRRETAAPRGAIHRCQVDAGFVPALQRLSAASGATPFMIHLAAYAALLSRYSGQPDLVIGTGIANRDHRDTEAMIGFFVNTLALRIDLGGNPTFRELIDRVRHVSLGAFAHARTPFHRVVEAVGAGRGASLYRAMFVLQNTPVETLGLGRVGIESIPVEQAIAKTDIVLELTERGGSVTGLVEYNAELFAVPTIAGMMAHLQTLLEAAVSAPDCRLDDLPLIGAGERARILSGLSGGRSRYPSDRSLHQLVGEQAAATPDATALVAGDLVLTYRELNRRANRLARTLLARGVTPDTPVGIFAERSLELVIGLLGILKAGAAYVSFETGGPDERLAFMLADSGARLVLADAALADRVARSCGGGVEVMLLDESGEPGAEPDPAVPAFPDGLAYVSYTSGSTGRPKGVEITHRGVVRLVRDTTYAAFGPGEIALLFAPVSFDASTFEIWGALANGGTLVVAPPGPEALDTLGDVLARHQVTTMWMTAGLFHMIADERLDDFAGLRQLVAGGDVLSPPRVRSVLRAHPALTLVNGYGPTEGTTFTCCHRMTAGTAVGARVAIGTPIPNTQTHVVDQALQIAPVGVHGELYIGGAGLARAYRGRAALTAERFVPDPFGGAAGARLYRSGDRVRLLDDGMVEFVERLDAQVKIRGFRVDPGEIETHLRAHPSVQDALVIVRRDGSGAAHLAAYVTRRAGAGPASARELGDELKARVPAYMVPSAFVWLDAFPLNENGKVDRRALPEPTLGGGTGEHVAPRSATEQAVAAIWSEVLGGVVPGVHDDFFALGGHSLLATRVMARLRQRFRDDLPFRIVFERPTVETLAEAIDERLGAAAAAGAGAREELEI